MMLELFWQRQVIVVESSYLDDVCDVAEFGPARIGIYLHQCLAYDSTQRLARYSLAYNSDWAPSWMCYFDDFYDVFETS